MPKIPDINHLAAMLALEKAGFSVVRQGKHIIMSDGARILTIPRNNPINAFTLGGIVRDAGITPEKLRRKNFVSFFKYAHASNRVPSQAIFGFYGVLFFNIGFMMVNNFLMQATMTTLGGFPAFFRRSANTLIA